MVSIGKIRIRRIIDHHLLPPTYEAVVKGPAFGAQVSQPILKHPLISTVLPGSGGGVSVSHKSVAVFITQNVAVSDSVNRVVTPGVLGISYTQTSFTFESYTVAGTALAKSLTENISITEPLSVQRSKTRVLFDEVPDNSESSETTTIERGKTRALAETTTITESLTVETGIQKTLIESPAISDSVAIQVQKRRALPAEDVGIEDIITRVRPTIDLALAETETITDSVNITVIKATGTHVTKGLTENVVIAENAVFQSAITRALATELVPVTETVEKTVTVLYVSYSNLSYTSLSYSATDTTRRLEKTIIETEEESHTVRISTTKNRGLTETTVIVG